MGWQGCTFLVTPKELQTALEPFKLVIHNACVPIDYTHTPVEAFLENYSALYERLIEGETFTGRYTKLLTQIVITSDLSDIKFGMEHELDGQWVKAVINHKRSVLPYLAPFTFNTYQENGKIYVSTRASYLAYSDSIFGYEINFPKFSRSDAGYYGLASEKKFKTYPDYELFRKDIMKITVPFSFNLNGVIKKTSIRISPEVKAYLPNLHCIRSKGIEVL